MPLYRRKLCSTTIVGSRNILFGKILILLKYLPRSGLTYYTSLQLLFNQTHQLTFGKNGGDVCKKTLFVTIFIHKCYCCYLYNFCAELIIVLNFIVREINAKKIFYKMSCDNGHFSSIFVKNAFFVNFQLHNFSVKNLFKNFRRYKQKVLKNISS